MQNGGRRFFNNNDWRPKGGPPSVGDRGIISTPALSSKQVSLFGGPPNAGVGGLLFSLGNDSDILIGNGVLEISENRVPLSVLQLTGLDLRPFQRGVVTGNTPPSIMAVRGAGTVLFNDRSGIPFEGQPILYTDGFDGILVFSGLTSSKSPNPAVFAGRGAVVFDDPTGFADFQGAPSLPATCKWRMGRALKLGRPLSGCHRGMMGISCYSVTEQLLRASLR